MERICPVCGKSCIDTLRFCPSCGTDLITVDRSHAAPNQASFPYTQNGAFTQNNSYPSNAPYTKPETNTQNNPYPQTPTYARNGEHLQNNPYIQNGASAQNTPYAQNPSYSPNGIYTQQDPYTPNGVYIQNAPYVQSQPYNPGLQPSMQQTQKDHSGLWILLGIGGGILLTCIAVIIITASVLLLKPDNSGSYAAGSDHTGSVASNTSAPNTSHAEASDNHNTGSGTLVNQNTEKPAEESNSGVNTNNTANHNETYDTNSHDWMSSPAGSATRLDGTTLLLSIFINDKDSKWDVVKQNIVMEKMDIAYDFLAEEGRSYGKDVTLIYDIREYPELYFTTTYPGYIEDDDDTSYELLDYVTEYIDRSINSEQLMRDYNVDSIGYMCFLNENGVSYTFPYYEGDSEQYYYECCFMFLKDYGEYEPPAVYAHEMLHLFGARDLYATSRYDGISKEFVQYIENNYPNEIMLTTYDENWENVQDHVSNDLTDITAYFIGWLDYIPELDVYPSIELKNPGCFSETENPVGDFSDYTAGDE